MAYNRQDNRIVVLAEVNMILAGQATEAEALQNEADASYYDYYYGGGEFWNDYQFGTGLREDEYPYWNHVENKWEY